MEHLLAPGRDSIEALIVTGIFLLYRFFVLVLLPGWIASRLFHYLYRTFAAQTPR